MRLTNKQLLEFARTKNPKEKLHIDSRTGWLAAQCATQLSGKHHIMNAWSTFEESVYPSGKSWDSNRYTEVTPEYAKWSEGINGDTYISYQDAVEALESFV